MTYARAERYYSSKTEPNPVPKYHPLQESDQLSATSEKVQDDSRPKRGTPESKPKKRVTWAKPLVIHHTLGVREADKPSAPEPAQILQYMKLQYNCKETQTAQQQAKGLVDDKVS